MSPIPEVKQIALVTGGGSGIGRGVALRLARDGRDVAVADINQDRVKEVAAEIEAIGVRSLALTADVSKEDEVKGMIDNVCNTLGGLDIVKRWLVSRDKK